MDYKHILQRLHSCLTGFFPRIFGLTSWDNQVGFTFHNSSGTVLPRTLVSVGFDPVYTDEQSTKYNIYSDQVESGRTPHISSDSTNNNLVLNWSCGRSGSKYTSFNFDCAWKGDPNYNFFGPKPCSGIIATYTDPKKQKDQMHSPSKVNFWYVAWFTVKYADGESRYRIVLAQDGNSDHILHDLEEVYDLAKSGWDLYKDNITGAVKKLKDFTGKLGKDKHKNIWYLGVAGDLGIPPNVPPPPFGTKMPPVYMHVGDGSNSGFNSSSTGLIFTDVNGKHPVRVVARGSSDCWFDVYFLETPIS
jgi:hypothetical protein